MYYGNTIGYSLKDYSRKKQYTSALAFLLAVSAPGKKTVLPDSCHSNQASVQLEHFQTGKKNSTPYTSRRLKRKRTDSAWKVAARESAWEGCAVRGTLLLIWGVITTPVSAVPDWRRAK